MNYAKHLMLAAVIAALPLLAAAADEEAPVTGHVVIGGWTDEVDGSPDRVQEFAPEGDGPLLGAMVSAHQSWGSLVVSAHGTDADDVDAGLSFDIGRVFRSETSFTSLLHRLGHDPMTNLEATSTNGKVVWHEDLDPHQDYDLSYQVLTHRSELQLPQFPALTVAVEYRDQRRDGHRQAFTTSHCDTCHITSQSHPVEEKTSDAKLEAKLAFRGGSVAASLSSRELTHGVSNLWLTFDDALHPELQVPVFDNRLQYDSAEGAQMVDLWPNIEKETTRLDLSLSNVGGFVINGGAVFSETENSYSGLESEYAGYAVNAARRFDSGVRLQWRGRVYSIDNDDVFVDTNERVTMAGPHANSTYEDIYGVNYDWWRLSSLNRDVLSSKLDLSYRISRTVGTVKLLWDFESIDREHYQVAVGETKTTTNKLGISWRARPAKGLRLNARLTHADVDNPFMLVDGACSTLVSPGYPNPWSVETPQYDEQHQSRIAETTASPSSWNEAKLGLSFTSGKTTVSGSYRYWDGDNDNGDLTDWSRSNQTLMLSLWSAPTQTWDYYVAYTVQSTDLDAPMCIPVFDG